ncbi:MAG: methyltransferase domain-containing protein [Pyrinomonadaceae bacterium]
MAKTQKEMAFLRDLIADDWTRRFTELVDKHLDLSDSENLLYINAGTGGHALFLDEKFGSQADIFASCENEDMLTIARDKAAAVSSRAEFSAMRFEDDAFDAVLADASFVPPSGVEGFIGDTIRVARTGGDVAIFLPSAGSFGEVFSLLWEVLYTDDPDEHGHAAESLINELPSVSRIEAIAANAGMVNVRTETATEILEFDNGKAFVTSPLAEDFLFPNWLATLDENERERVTNDLAELIETEDGEMSFKFSIKATLLTGEKG